MIALTVNGGAVRVAPEGRTSLADLLREELLLTGTHLGCEQGVCGACTVLLDGAPVRSCLTLAAGCGGTAVRTVEGFEDDARMAALRAAFSRRHALQCGFCTPGMLVTAYDIVSRLPGADEARVRQELAGNLCRCTGYQGIVEAVLDVLAATPPPSASPPPPPQAREGLELGVPPPPAGEVARSAGGGAGTHLTRRLPLAATQDQVWSILRDLDTVAALLPGAAITRRDGDQVEGAFTAALGPIKASFAGQASVIYGETARSVTVDGAGSDRLTRTTATGQLSCEVQPAASGCVAVLGITYRLSGPLASFGRPAVVAGLVDAVLARFAAGLEARVTGNTTRRGGFLAWLRRVLRL